MKFPSTLRAILPGVLCLPFAAFSQEAKPAAEADPFSSTGPSETERWTNSVAARPALRLRIETWEAPALEVAKRLDELEDPAGLAKLRAECLSGAPGVTLVFSPVMRLDPAGKTTVESITERIYPTEYEPPSLPCAPVTPPKLNTPATLADIVESAFTHTTPTSFETRNTGFTLEAEVHHVNEAEKTWEIDLAMDDVHFVQTESFGADLLKITMPVFSAFRSQGRVRLKQGDWQLLSVMEPPRGMDGKISDRRWVTIMRIDPQK